MTITLSERTKPTVNTLELLEQFYQDCRDRGLTEETIGRYKSALKLFHTFLKARSLTIFEVGRYVLRDFIRYRRENGGKEGEGVKQKTLENNFSALSSFYEYLCFEEYIQSNPVLPVRKRFLTRYKKDGDDDPPRKLISVEDMAILVNSILNVRDKALVLLLAKTGVRRGELIKIDVDDINWSDNSINLKRFKKRSNRMVFFDDECARVLKRWVKIREQLNPKSESLFIGEHRGRLKRNGVYSLVCKHAAKVGLHNANSPRLEDHFTPHCFRHWFTTWLRRNGMPREFIKELRGDRRREAVDIYDHIEKEELKRAYLACIPELGV